MTTREDPDKVRLTGKGKYKGRTYYLGLPTRDGNRQHLYSVPDNKGEYIEFWADADKVEVTKTYTPRVRSFRNREWKEYTTLGGIATFIRGERAKEAAGLPQCAACGKRNQLIEDLEDGLMKCPSCCDIPSS